LTVTNQNIFIKHYIYLNITAQDVEFSTDQNDLLLMGNIQNYV